MSLKDRLVNQILYMKVSGEAEVKNPNDYIFSSLTNPPLKVVNRHGTDDEMEWDVECPNCNKIVNYGEGTAMVSGHVYCFTEGCRESLMKKLEHKEV